MPKAWNSTRHICKKKSKQPETTTNLDTAMWQTTVKAAIGSTRFICSWQEAQHVYQNVLFVGQAQSLSINNLEMSSNSKRALGLLDPLGLWHPLHPWHPWHPWHPRHPSLAEALRSLAVGGCARPSAAFCKPWNNLARCSTLWHIAWANHWKQSTCQTSSEGTVQIQHACHLHADEPSLLTHSTANFA